MRSQGPPDGFFDRSAVNEWLKSAAVELPSYGLAHWDGHRQLSGHGRGTSNGLTSIKLLHGDYKQGRPLVMVSTSTQKRRPKSTEPYGRVNYDLPGQADNRTIGIPIDDETVTFMMWAGFDHWLAEAHHNGLFLELYGEALPVDEILLTRITDITPYLVDSDI